MSFRGPQGLLVFTDWPECQTGPTVFVEADGHAQPALSDGSFPLDGSYPLLDYFLGCQLWTAPPVECSYLSWLRSSSPSASSTADPMASFCANLHQLGTWFSADIANANGDDVQLAQEVQGTPSLPTVAPNEQAITDPQARAAADGIITDALALQNWTPAAGTSFAKQLSTFTTDSGSFVSRYCS